MEFASWQRSFVKEEQNFSEKMMASSAISLAKLAYATIELILSRVSPQAVIDIEGIIAIFMTAVIVIARRNYLKYFSLQTLSFHFNSSNYSWDQDY